MSSRLSYLEESTVEKHQFEQMESKVCIIIFKNHVVSRAVSSLCFDFTLFVLQRRELATQLDLEGSFKKRQEVHIFLVSTTPVTEAIANFQFT